MLSHQYEVTKLDRKQADLRDSGAVEAFLGKRSYDVILHCANPNPVKNGDNDRQECMFEDSMRIFSNFYHVSEMAGRLYYLGSGAEYDKSRPLCRVKEETIGERVPYDMYGLSKYCMNEMAKASRNVYNLRIFGCYGPYDHESKFLTHVIRCCLASQTITIRQNCYFDYMQVSDFARAFMALDNCGRLDYHDYNICTGNRVSLLEIAEIIRDRMGADCGIRLLKDGLNKEYTGDNQRFLHQIGTEFAFTELEQGIDIQIAHERKHWR